MKENKILQAYEIAKERYAAIGVDTDKAIETLEKSFLAHIRVIIKKCTKHIRITKKSGHTEYPEKLS